MKNVTICLIILCGAISFSGKEGNIYKGFNLKKFEKSQMLIPDTKLYYSFEKRSPKERLCKTNETEVQVNSFYMYQHEVSNGEYMEFVNDIKKADIGLYNKMLPDSTVWSDKLSFNELYVQYYFRHPAYSNYPVVGITHEQAEYYCKWLTETYNKEEKRKFRNATFELPDVTQWISAAKGGGLKLNENGKWMANFNVIPQINIGRQSQSGSDTIVNMEYAESKWVYLRSNPLEYNENYYPNSYITTPVISYLPNNYGVYNMFGNVEEYMKEEGITKGGSWRDTGYYLQIDVEEKYDSTNYTSAERGFRFVMELNN